MSLVHARGLALVRLRSVAGRSGCRCLAAHRRGHRADPQALVPSSPDAWERWEFGDEGFIDKALAEVKTPPRDPAPRNLTPLDSTGVVSFVEAIKVLRPYLSDERRAKIDEVLAWRCGNVRFVIEDPINPSNAWACLRTLDSYGIQ